MHGDLRGFKIANFADHYDVRILPHDGAQRVGKRQVNLWLHLYLVDAGHLVFDRVLDSEDLYVRLVQPVKRGVKRGGFAATGGARHEQDAVRLVENCGENLQVCIVETERMKVQRDAALVENTHHHALAVHGRYR